MSEPIQSIAQNNYILHNIDAKKLYVQEPLFTANSGDAVYVGWRPDETVLWEGNYTGTKTKEFNLSESYTNFDQLEIWWGNQPGTNARGIVITRYPNNIYQNAWQGINACSDSDAHLSYKMCFLSANSNTQLTAYNYRQAAIGTTAAGNFVWGKDKEYYECYPVKIIGVNRISGGNS